MSFPSGKWIVFALFIASARPVAAQTSPKPDYFHKMWAPAAIPDRVPGPEGLRDYVIDGKLRVSVDDAVRLTLLNNTTMRLDALMVDQARNNVLGSYAPFDPQEVTSVSSNRSSSPTYSQLQGAPTLTNLAQQLAIVSEIRDYLNSAREGYNCNFVFRSRHFNEPNCGPAQDVDLINDASAQIYEEHKIEWGIDRFEMGDLLLHSVFKDLKIV